MATRVTNERTEFLDQDKAAKFLKHSRGPRLNLAIYRPLSICRGPLWSLKAWQCLHKISSSKNFVAVLVTAVFTTKDQSPRVPLCPLTIPLTTFTIVHRIVCSPKSETSSYHCSAVFLGVSVKACWVWASNRSAELAAVGPPRCYKKARNFWAGDPPPPPLNKHNRFQHTVPSHIKVVRLNWGRGRGVRGKKPSFLRGRHMAKKAQIQ